MRSKIEMLELRLREIDPVPGQGPPIDPAAEELLERILATDPRRLPSREGRLSRPRRRLLTVSAALAAVAVTVAIVGLPGDGGQGPSGLPVLEEAAAAAAAQPSPPQGLPYLYVKRGESFLDTTVFGGESWSIRQTEIDQEWIAKDGSGRLRRVLARPAFVSAADRETWEAAGRPNFLAHGFGRHVEDTRKPAGSFNQMLPDGGGSISELPTDPTDLAAWLSKRASDPHYGGGGWPLSIKTLDLAAQILQNPVATPEQRAALYEAEAQIPGIRDLGPTSDVVGRRGVAVGASSANSGAPTLYSMVFNPDTSEVLATQQKVLKAPSGMPGLPTPIVTETSLYFASGSTASIRAAP
jgi:hypothetical protein